MVETAHLAGLIEVDELGRSECLRLLACGSIGRVIFSEAAMPAAQPVTYLTDGGVIVFRTAAESSLAFATRGTVVAFEADEIDHQELTGWTVLGIGTTFPVTEPDRLADLAGPPRASEGGIRPAVVVAIRLELVTGHLLRPAVDPSPRPAGPSTVATGPGQQ